MSILEYITPCQRSGVSRAEEIARDIEGIIVELGSKPGTRLGTKESLRRRFDVSPGTMNEAVRILEVRSIIRTRRGAKGGVFVVAATAQIPFSEFELGLAHNAALIEQCQAVSHQLEPLVFVEATRAANVGALAELQRLVQKMAATVDEPTESLRCSWLLYRHIAEMGHNTVLTGIYTTLLKFLEQEIGHRVAPIANCSNSQQVVASSNGLIEAIASGDTHRVVGVAKRQSAHGEKGVSNGAQSATFLPPSVNVHCGAATN